MLFLTCLGLRRAWACAFAHRGGRNASSESARFIAGATNAPQPRLQPWSCAAMLVGPMQVCSAYGRDRLRAVALVGATQLTNGTDLGSMARSNRAICLLDAPTRSCRPARTCAG